MLAKKSDKGKALCIWIGESQAQLLRRLDIIARQIGIKRNKLVVRILQNFINTHFYEGKKKD